MLTYCLLAFVFILLAVQYIRGSKVFQLDDPPAELVQVDWNKHLVARLFVSSRVKRLRRHPIIVSGLSALFFWSVCPSFGQEELVQARLEEQRSHPSRSGTLIISQSGDRQSVENNESSGQGVRRILYRAKTTSLRIHRLTAIHHPSS